ncbi:MAG: hypothetical protein KZQ95_00755 [Candidatus Thiodiazotropha sp. (ex Epidulcina cf. delphinae)]|nr:hypothetical protein [Candidatus Thiodiazotropha sp. (ex Epidulcina cf. delphinae)]
MEPIGDFYIVDEDWSSEDLKQSQPAKAANLNALHQVMKQLSESATVVDKEKRRLLFADSAGLVSLPIDISPEDLRAVTPQRADAFVHFCADMLHRQHRLEVMANVVILQTRGVTANDRLHYVLRNLESILSDAKSQHAVFLSAFSYEKVRDEIESLKVEYTTKIHKVISEIQGQLLGIPAATVVVAIQLKKADAIDSIFITNMAVLLGALIFGVFMILLLINQAHTLEVIKPEVGRQKRQLRTELLDVADRFDDVFTLLQNRIRYQNGILWSVVAGLLLSGMAFWVLSSIANRSIF